MENQILKKDDKEAKRVREWHYKKTEPSKAYCYTPPILLLFLGVERYGVYLYISSSVQMNGWSYFKYEDIMNDLDLSRQKISNILRSLRSIGIVIKHKMIGSNNVYYTISTEALDKIVMIVNEFRDIHPKRLRKELEGVNLNAVSFEYVKKLIWKYIPETRGTKINLFDE